MSDIVQLHKPALWEGQCVACQCEYRSRLEHYLLAALFKGPQIDSALQVMFDEFHESGHEKDVLS